MPSTASFRVTDFSLGGTIRTRASLLSALATARGVGAGDQKAFFEPLPPVRNPFRLMPDCGVAIARLQKALLLDEPITIFGDYDVDGVTSLVQILDLLRAAGHKKLRLYIPDRIAEDYGLTREAVDNCLEAQNPKLIFTVDCGSASIEVIEYLKGRGVDAIVLDHHHVPEHPGKHPALAHLNPRGFPNLPDEAKDLLHLSAAGLAFLFSEIFVETVKLPDWSRPRALILAGLGTLVDVMPLNNAINRALVKHSLHEANSEAILDLPGLRLLQSECQVKRFDSFSYGFVIGPHLNAAGRLSTAQTAAKVLGARSEAAAAPFVPELLANNRARRATQETILLEAEQMAEEMLLANPNAKVLLLANSSWHPGVVGIVASRIKERFRRPAFVCGGAGEGLFKGSGRSVPGINLGQIVTQAKAAGLLLSGGGHAMAAGIKFDQRGYINLLDWLHAATSLLQLETDDHFEVLGPVELFSTAEWFSILAQLEPFGNANERVRLLAEDSLMVNGPTPLTKHGSEEVWGWGGIFELSNGDRIRVTWADIDKPPAVWSHGLRFRMVLSLTRTPKKTGGFYENWKVDAAERHPKSPIVRA